MMDRNVVYFIGLILQQAQHDCFPILREAVENLAGFFGGK
jgi:hypothetical protein